jgi:prephenate dehydrogenase
LSHAGFKVLKLSSDEHDRLIAETLFLTHLIGQTVHKAGFERTSVDTLSFGFLMNAVESVAHDENLFHDVFTFNPYCKDVLTRFEEAKHRVLSSLTQY